MAHPAQNCREEKEEHPERYCAVPGCLWKIKTRQGDNPCRKHQAFSSLEKDQPTDRQVLGW